MSKSGTSFLRESGHQLRVAGRLQRGEPDDVLIDYLVGIETGHMRLADTPAARARAEATVAATREQVEGIQHT